MNELKPFPAYDPCVGCEEKDLRIQELQDELRQFQLDATALRVSVHDLVQTLHIEKRETDAAKAMAEKMHREYMDLVKKYNELMRRAGS